MTLKNSLISISAAALLVAGITGCSSNGTTTVAEDPVVSSIASSVQAVDGYIYNGLVKAYYLDDDNVTMNSVTLTNTDTTKNTDTLAVTLGSSTYSLAEANTSIQDKIRFFTIASKGSSDDGVVTFTPATYIESDGVDGYDVNDTLLGATTIFAPATSSIVSPLSNLVYLASQATLGTTAAFGTAQVDLNTTTFAQVEGNATVIATNLGLSGVDLLADDPVELAATNPTFRLVNALMLGSGAADLALIQAATAPTTLAEVLTLVGTTAADGAGLANTLAPLASDGAFTTSDISGLNIEASVVQGGIVSLVAPTISGKFPISGISTNGISSSLLNTGAGNKYCPNVDTLDVNMTLAGDVNVSNTTFNLLIAYKSIRSSIADDVNTSSAVVAKIPFDLNITDGAVATAGIAAGSTVVFQVKAKDGSQTVTKTDMNATTLGLATTDIDVNADILEINVKNIVAALKVAGDANTTAGLETICAASIADVQVMLQDVNGSMIVGATDADTNLPLARANFSDIGTAAITGTEVYKLLVSSTFDNRDGLTQTNTAPAIADILTNGDDSNDILIIDDNNDSVTTGDNLIANKIIVNEGTGSTELNITVSSVATGGEDSEVNATMAIGTLPAWITVASSSASEGAIGAGTDFTLTVDGNHTTSAETSTDVNVTITDEFGKTAAANNQTLTFVYNLAPTLTTVAGVQADTNLTVTYAGSVSNVQGLALVDGTATTAGECDVIADNNGTSAFACAVSATDGNLTITVDANTTNVSGWAATVQMTDAYGATSSEYNVTATGITEL